MQYPDAIGGGELTVRIREYWSARLQVPVHTIDNAATEIRGEEDRRGNGRFTVYRYGQRTDIRCDPNFEAELRQAVAGLEKQIPLTPTELQLRLGHHAEHYLGGVDYFLEPSEFRPAEVPKPYELRLVDGHDEQDAKYLATLYNACTEQDLDEADIWVDEPDPLIYGVFDGDLMVAYASHRPEKFYPAVVDIGVLIHPDYRRQGLGRSVVAADCLWCLQHGTIPMYRHSNDNQGSRRIAEGLGFRRQLLIDVYDWRA